MKNSGIPWIGEIPSHWDISRVKHFFIRKNEKAHQENPVILSLARSGVKIRDISTNEGQMAESYYDYNPVEVNDLLLNPMDLYSGANCSISKVRGVISPAYINLRSKNGASPRYYDYFFKTQYWGMTLFAHGRGISFDNRWTLGVDTLFDYSIPVPPSQEQQSIADFLDKKCGEIDEMISLQEKIIEELKAYKQSVITEAVCKGLNPDVPMKDSGIEWIGQIPCKWEVSFITKNLYSLVDYRGKTPEKVDDGVFLITARNIKDGKIDYTISKEYVNPKDYDEIMHRGKPEIGDVLFTTEAPLGAVANVDNPHIALAQRIIKLRPKKEILNPFYLKYWMMSIGFQQFLSTLATGSTAAGIKGSKLYLLRVLLPPIAEQKAIANYLDEKCSEIDSLIALKQSKIESLKEYKKSIIYEYVTGKKEVL